MKVSGKRWLFLLLPVSVIVLSMVYSIVMIAFFREPVIVDVIEVDPVSWSMERPSEDVHSFEPIESVYSTDSASLKFSLFFLIYRESSTSWEKDSFIFAVNATGKIDGGFVHSAGVNFSIKDGDSSLLNISEDPDAWGDKYLQNFVLQEIVDHRPVSYVRVLGIGESYSNMRAQGDWTFLDDHEVDHQLTVVMYAVWFNGTAYLRTILPIQLEVTVT